ncbi:hypothetical protein PpBr36_07403 [Pyricularia pennisetigena]|uniref:hypothetical protein n=1 Tax=Pyricularia pennisetigena TaxID=1578925 RepID=UPI00114F3F95|nr:hypothetical protein PpBr36_07403 [Pyricularia pennisetigena]TLS25429.1 hypothetical protein PpBr36_07403 [Pyricularia pennisetigena]
MTTPGDTREEASAVLSPRSFALKHMRPKSSFLGCAKIAEYEVLGKLGEGTFGEVHKARSKKTGAIVALKKIIMHNEKDGFPITALREIKLLKLLSHPNVLRLEDMAVEHPQNRSDKRKRPIMHMVFPYMDHDLSGLLDNPSVKFTEAHIKCYLIQLLEGLRYLHENKILHRDMKAANLLINNKGILQIADFGLARHYDGPVPQPGRGGGEGTRNYTSLVVTRWYRPPELLLHLKAYTTAIDMWGVGCVFGEMLTGKPILSGESDGHQLELIWDLCGTPTEDTMPGWRKLPGAEAMQPKSRPGNLSQRFREHGQMAVSLLKELLKLDWKSRINAIDALQHPYFRTAPMPSKPEDIPTFEDSHELDRRRYHDRPPKALPPAPKGGAVGRGPMDGPGPNHGYQSGDYGGRNGANGGRYPPPHRGAPNGEPERRQPAWSKDRNLGLPPRPPPPAGSHNGMDNSSRDVPPPRSRGNDRAGGGGRADVDTYIPSYSGGGRRDDRMPPRDDRRRRDDRDDRRYDRDRAYDDRGRSSRTRSRSPIRDRDRDRERDRDRDLYRR